MIAVIREEYGLDSPRVFSAMLRVPREKFASRAYRDIAYADGPVPISFGQTMSQPYTVAFMTHLLDLDPASRRASRGKKVLEIGTGSGYQAAVLSLLAKEVYTIEIIGELADYARRRFKRLGYKNVHVREGSGEHGWKEAAPFDAIMVTAGIAGEVPRPLFRQLKETGVLVAPMGAGDDKVMTKFTKLKNGKTKKQEFSIFHFVPFIEE